jgi:N-acetyl-anhydromuramyl-L-alanine amidase AmpD
MIDIRKPDPPLNFRSRLIPLKKVNMIILHHMEHKTADIQAVHNHHRSRTYKTSSGKTADWSGIGYNYFITFDGTIYEARGLNVGAHTLNYNNRSIGIGFQGDFQQQQMPDAQLKAGATLCHKLLRDHTLSEKDLKLHKDLSTTACPGKTFRFTELKELLRTVQYSAEEVIYRVQVGAFKNREYAENLKQQLIKQGYTDAFIDDN